MTQNDQIEKYTQIVKIRNLLKTIQQLSWNITQFERRYPLENATEDQYPAILNAYLEFIDQLCDIADVVNNVDERVSNENKNNKD